MTVAEVLLAWLGAVTLLSVATICATAIVVVRTLARIAPPPQARPVPPFVGEAPKRGRRARNVVATAHDDTTLPPLEGTNAYPQQPQNVDSAPEVTEIAGIAERQLKEERDQWWAEMREEGYDDAEIAKIEASRIVDVFGGR